MLSNLCIVFQELIQPSDALIKLLAAISTASARHVTDGTLPLLFIALPDEAPSRDSPIEISKYRRVLQLLARLCIQPPLFETLVIRLLAKLDILFSRTGDAVDSEPVAAYAHSLLQTLSRVLALKVKENHVDIPKYLDLLIIPLYNLFVSSALQRPDGIATNERLLVVAGKVISIVVRALPTRSGDCCCFKRPALTVCPGNKRSS